MSIRFRHLFIVIIFGTLLQGCAAIVVGAGVGAASAAHDRRTLGTQVDDTTATNRLSLAISSDAELKDVTRINVDVFNGIALLVGQAPNEALKQRASVTAQSVKNIRKFHNLIRIAKPISAGTVTHDVWLASKVRAALLAEKNIDGLHISVMVEDSEVFLIGLVNESEANIAVEIARNVNGVARVVKAFEYL